MVAVKSPSGAVDKVRRDRLHGLYRGPLSVGCVMSVWISAARVWEFTRETIKHVLLDFLYVDSV